MSKQATRVVTYLTLFMVFILPTGLLFGTFNSIHNHLFTFALLAIFYFDKLLVRKDYRIDVTKLLFYFIILVGALITKRLGIIDMVIIPILFDFLKQRDEIVRIIKKSKVPYFCIIFTIIYTFLYLKVGYGGRGEGSVGSGLLFTAIGEVNLTGLSIFCLSMILVKKNKPIGLLVAALGLLTISRSYILALLCVLLFSTKFMKRITSKIVGFFTYGNLALISCIVLILLGELFVNLYVKGKIVEHSTTAGVARIFVFNDLSNYFRFFAIYLITRIILRNKSSLIFGFSDETFISEGRGIAASRGLLFNEIGTHNLFFSHLKMYGLFTVPEVLLTSKAVRKITSTSNVGIFLAIFLYCIILGTGFNSYWLYLTAIVLCMHYEFGVQ